MLPARLPFLFLVSAVLVVHAGTAAEDAPASRDLVILDNKQTIPGRVEEDPTSADHVLIKSTTGSIRILKKRIRSAELGLAGRIASVKDTDYQGLVDLARWCLSQHHPTEALAALDKAMMLVRADPSLLKDLSVAVLYLRLMDEIRGPEIALPLYRWYRQLGGTDADTLRRLEALEAVAGPAPAGSAPIMPVLAPTAAPVPKEAPVSERDRLIEGLETKGWQAESEQWSNPISSKLVPLSGKEAGKDGQDAKRTLEILCGSGGKDKATLRKPLAISAVAKHILIFRVKNSAEFALRIAIGVKTGDYEYFESEPQVVKYGEGYKELRFNLTSKTFKSAASNWVNNVPVANLEDLKEVQVVFYNRDAEVTSFISGMRFIAEDEL